VKKLICLAVAVVMTLSLASIAVSDETHEKLELQMIMWGENARFLAQEEVNKAFTEKYPDITVNLLQPGDDYWGKINTMIAGGTPPDVAFQQEMNTPTHASRGYMLELDDFMASDPEFERSWIAEPFYGPFTYDGHVYALPITTYVNVLFYNIDMFDNAGLAYPTEDWTWKDLLEAALKLTIDENSDGKPEQYGFWYNGVINFLYGWIWSNGGEVIESDRKTPALYSDANIQTYQFLHDLVYKHGVTPAISMNKDNMYTFETGRVAMADIGSWMTVTYDRNELNYGMTLTPKSPYTGQRSAMTYPNAWFIVKPGLHHEEAWELVKFCASLEGQEIGAKAQVGMPTNETMMNSDLYLKSSSCDLIPTIETVQFARGPFSSTNQAEIDSVVYAEFDAIWQDENADVASILQYMNDMLADYLLEAQ
jgi:multiple sugar transport system substrate-binding protein